MDVDDEADGDLAMSVTIGFMEQMDASHVSPPTALLAAMNCAALIAVAMAVPNTLAVKLFRDVLKSKSRNK
jgi:hypothetical protein